MKIDNDRLVFEPSVRVVGWSALDVRALTDWMREFAPDSCADGTMPGGRLIDDAVLGRRNPLDLIVEFAGRQCYRSFTKGRGIEAYIDNILTQGHGSVLEHATVNLAVAGVSRSLSHELVRHRSGWAYSQESQRYVEARDVRLVVPPAIIDADLVLWWAKLQEPALEAFALTADKLVEVGLNRKQALEAARSALPNAAETRLLGTVNIRALRHFLELRGSTGADREIRRFANAVLAAVLTTWEHPPLVLNDLASTGADGTIHSKYRKV